MPNNKSFNSLRKFKLRIIMINAEEGLKFLKKMKQGYFSSFSEIKDINKHIEQLRNPSC